MIRIKKLSRCNISACLCSFFARRYRSMFRWWWRWDVKTPRCTRLSMLHWSWSVQYSLLCWWLFYRFGCCSPRWWISTIISTGWPVLYRTTWRHLTDIWCWDTSSTNSSRIGSRRVSRYHSLNLYQIFWYFDIRLFEEMEDQEAVAETFACI